MRTKRLLWVAALVLLGGSWAFAEDYTFKASDWAYTGDGGRIAQANISVAGNVITLKGVNANNNAALKYGSTTSYTFAHTATRLVIKGTNLSTDVSKHAIWWLNNGNNNSSQSPVLATETDGTVTLTWNLAQFPYAMRKNTLHNWTLSNAGTSTIFGLTPATMGSDVTITDIKWECASEAYTFHAEDWAHTGDRARITQDKISVSGNVITLADVSGANNAALEFDGVNEYLFPRSLASITITGTNLSTTAGQHAFWWLNGANNAGSINATDVSEADGKQSITWDLTAINAEMRPTIIGEWEMLTKPAFLSETWRHSTLFGLTPAVDGNVTITDIQLTMVDDANIVTRTTANGSFGTICLPKQALPSGATIYSVEAISANNLTLTALPANSYMSAGTPYIYKATQDNPTFTMSGEAVSEPVAATGLVGTFTEINAPKGDSYFVLSGNKLYNVDEAANVTVGANRAYIDLTAVPTGGSVKAGTASLALVGYTATGISLASEVTSQKNDVIVNLAGQRLQHPVRGINIINGKKVVVK